MGLEVECVAELRPANLRPLCRISAPAEATFRLRIEHFVRSLQRQEGPVLPAVDSSKPETYQARWAQHVLVSRTRARILQSLSLSILLHRSIEKLESDPDSQFPQCHHQKLSLRNLSRPK